MRLGFLLALLLVAIPAAAGPAVTVYVAPAASGGSDSNPGTLAQPYLTVNKCVTVMEPNPGSTCYLRAGTYAEPAIFINATGGTSYDPSQVITLTVYQTETVTIAPSSSTSSIIKFDSNAKYWQIDGGTGTLIFDGTNTTSGVIRGNPAVAGTCQFIRLWNFEVKNSPTNSGITLDGGCNNFHIKNVRAHHHGSTNQTHGIYVAGPNNLIEYSETYSNGGCGIKSGASGTGETGVDNTIIRGNNSHNNGNCGIVLMNGTNQQVYNNLVWENGDPLGNGGIQVYVTNSNSLVYNNTAVANVGRGIQAFQSDDVNIQFRNNISYGNTTDYFDGGTGTDQDHNLFGVNPLFVNQAGHNYQLTEDSPAVDAGTTLAEVPDDYQKIMRPSGAAYDIGAYEFPQGSNGGGGGGGPSGTLRFRIRL